VTSYIKIKLYKRLTNVKANEIKKLHCNLLTQKWGALFQSCFNNDVDETLLLIATTDIQKSSTPIRKRVQEKMACPVGMNRNIVLAIPTSTTYVD
jgi:nicotinic acid mononucleotide adenylyltransferase